MTSVRGFFCSGDSTNAATRFMTGIITSSRLSCIVTRWCHFFGPESSSTSRWRALSLPPHGCFARKTQTRNRPSLMIFTGGA